MAIEVEAGFKVKESKEEAEKILLDNGFVNTFKTAHTRDVYFGKDIEIEGKSEEEIKRSMVLFVGLKRLKIWNFWAKNIPKANTRQILKRH